MLLLRVFLTVFFGGREGALNDEPAMRPSAILSLLEVLAMVLSCERWGWMCLVVLVLTAARLFVYLAKPSVATIGPPPHLPTTHVNSQVCTVLCHSFCTETPQTRKSTHQHYTFNTYATQNGRLQERKKIWQTKYSLISDIIYAKN